MLARQNQMLLRYLKCKLFTPNDEVAYQTAAYGPRSSATMYQHARDIPAAEPSAHWDLMISSTPHVLKGTYHET